MKASRQNRDRDSIRSSKTRNSLVPKPSAEHPLLRLQRVIGNRTLTRLVKSIALQAKLRIGSPEDKYEREAENTSQQVINEESQIQRQSEKQEDALPQVITEKITPLLQGQVDENTMMTSQLQNQLDLSKESGQALGKSERAFFEPRFNHDFSYVRIHKDTQAAQTAQDFKARAFTLGRDIFFDSGQFAPSTMAGKRLLAHELTHTIQQKKNWQMPLPPGVRMTVGDYRIQRQISTPLKDYIKNVKAGKDAEFKIGDVDVVVKQDTTTKSKGRKQKATTSIIIHPVVSAYKSKGKVMGTLPKVQKITIQTTYGPGVTAKSPSVFGKGPSLGEHEGYHGADYLKYIKVNPPPKFKGKVGMKVVDYNKALKDFNNDLKAYKEKILEFSKQQTDCVQVKAPFCK